MNLRQRRQSKKQPSNQNGKNNDEPFLMEFDQDEDPLRNVKIAGISQSVLKPSLNVMNKNEPASESRNMSTNSGLTLLSVAHAQSTSQGLSSALSSRLSMNSKKRLVTANSADMKAVYAQLSKDLAVNKKRI